MSDNIKIEGLEIFANHGVLESEKKSGQIFIVNAVLHLDLRPAGKTGDLLLTVNYAEVCDLIVNKMTRERYDLIETCAEILAVAILQAYPMIHAVEITVEKPQAPIAHTFHTVKVSITRHRYRVYLSIGSNLGNREFHLNEVVRRFKDAEDIKINKVSSYHETAPVSEIPQGDYLNAIIECFTTKAPSEMMAYCLQTEAEIGRKRSGIKNEARVIDIDILSYEYKKNQGGIIVYQSINSDDPHITLPHPRMFERQFVLAPLFEVNKALAILIETV